MSQEISLSLYQIALPERVQEFIDAGLARGKEIDWFDFVPSDYGVVYTLLSALARGRLCEWGSGLGIVTGLAEMLGYTALGVEIHEPLAEASREFLARHNLQSRIGVGDYFERADQADLYFAYCWPALVEQTEAHFREIAPREARLIIYYGPRDIRWIGK